MFVKLTVSNFKASYIPSNACNIWYENVHYLLKKLKIKIED